MTDLAVKKLETEFSKGTYDKYAAIMKQGVKDALIGFCKQNTEFAQSVYQGGNFEDCMKTVAKNCGHGISDLEAYRRAVQFYFKGADIRYTMTVNLCASVEGPEDEPTKPKKEVITPPEPEKKSVILLDLSDFL